MSVRLAGAICTGSLVTACLGAVVLAAHAPSTRSEGQRAELGAGMLLPRGLERTSTPRFGVLRAVRTLPAEVNVSGPMGSQAEVTVVASPTEPDVLLAGANNLRPGGAEEGGVVAFGSSDGGLAWSASRPSPGTRGLCAIGDPAVAIDLQGRQFFAYLVDSCESKFRPTLYVATRAGAGEPWRSTLVADPGGGWSDKPALVVDTWPGSPHAGRAYLAWSRVIGEDPHVVVAHSDDGGETWSEPVSVQQDGDAGISFFAALAVSPTGDVYVGWQTDRREFLLARSSTGGDGFGPAAFVDRAPRKASKRCERGLMAIPAQARRCVTMSPNVIATDAGVTAVYVAAGVQRGTVEVRARVFDAALVPLGSPAAVHRSPAVDQFQAAAALDRTSGLIWACYYDTGGDSSRTHARFKCTASRDSGRNWATPVPAASVPSNESMYPATPFQFGDYQGLAIGADGRAHALWTDSRDIGRAGEQIYATSLSSSDLGF